MRALTIALLAALPLAGSCLTSQRVTHFGGGKLEAVQLRPAQAWRVVEDVAGGTEGAGFVVLMQSSTEAERCYFSVRNAWNQELGMVDALGRSWRFSAHEAEAQWLGSGSVADGAALVLEAEGHCRLEEVDLGQLSAPAAAAD